MLKAGESLFNAGEPADAAYFVLSGELSLAIDDAERRVEPGALVGETALMADVRVAPRRKRPKTANCCAFPARCFVACCRNSRARRSRSAPPPSPARATSSTSSTRARAPVRGQVAAATNGEGEIGLGGAAMMAFDPDRRGARRLQLDKRRRRQHREADRKRQRELTPRRRRVEPDVAAVENEEPFGHVALPVPPRLDDLRSGFRAPAAPLTAAAARGLSRRPTFRSADGEPR